MLVKLMLLLSTLSLCLACSCTTKGIGVERSDDDWTTICDGDTRYAAQNLKSRFSPLHSILKLKYRVERFSEGSPTSSLCILQVSEAECQGIKSYARFSASTAQRTNVDDIGDVIVKLDTCEADVAAEHSESLSCAYNNSLASSCPTVDSDSSPTVHPTVPTVHPTVPDSARQ